MTTTDSRTGSMAFVLHTHLPYCRLAGRWPHGEEWFHEAMLACYLPLVAAFRRLADEKSGTLGVTLNVTPILAEQMADPLMLQHFAEYLDERRKRANGDVDRFATGPRAATARFHADRIAAMHELFERTLRRDLVGALRELQERGAIELATSAATHGYLPLLGDDDAVRFQVKTGVAAHSRTFGRAPGSFWLPECAYKPGIEQVLEAEGVRVFFVETHLVTGGRPRGKAAGGVLGLYGQAAGTDVPTLPGSGGTTFRAYAVGSSNVAVMARNERCGKQVWSAADGYPGDGAYREFHKKDELSGLQYWRVTGDEVDLGEKAEYDPEAARHKALEHAAHFRGLVAAELQTHRAATGEPGIVMCSYDTELFGHWWLEGVSWLEEAIRGLRGDSAVELTTAGRFVTEHPPAQRLDMPEGSWGNGGDHRTWLNDATEWTWPEIRERQARAKSLTHTDSAASRQLLRELLLLQSSDWQFLMTTGQAREYAIERFRSHAARFDALAAAIEAGPANADDLADELYELDNPFPNLEPLQFGRVAREPSPA